MTEFLKSEIHYKLVKSILNVTIHIKKRDIKHFEKKK